jgi:hypothetical protein
MLNIRRRATAERMGQADNRKHLGAAVSNELANVYEFDYAKL